jgi:hypothetical protein
MTRFCKTLSMIPYSRAASAHRKVVAVVVALDLLRRAAGEFGHQRMKRVLEVDHVLRVALDVRDLALEAARGW